jgi:hypothetical protein
VDTGLRLALCIVSWKVKFNFDAVISKAGESFKKRKEEGVDLAKSDFHGEVTLVS